ncbi:MAG: DUF2815 family protein [Roseibium sp.]|nr:DUF2815 family protein [Roseibium sp.]
MANDDMIMLKDVRVSFPHLFTPPTINGEEGSCGAVLMLEPKRHSGDIGAIEDGIAELERAKFKGRKLPSDKKCLREGVDKGRPEYDGYMVVSANCRDTPIVIGTDGRSVVKDEKESKIYAGCYVNAKIRLWAQDNQYGKRANAELVAIQFCRDGEPLDGTYVSVDDAIDGFDDATDGFDGRAAANDDDDDFMAA